MTEPGPLRFVLSSALLAFLCIAGPAPAFQAHPATDQRPAAEPKTVRVTAEGYNREDALKQALRKALEQGAGVQLAGYSQTESFVLIRDTIYTRAAGIVSEYRILSERPGPAGTVVMEVEATVRPDAVAQAWGEVQNVLDQLGRPKIMVWIDEHIDGRPQTDSIVESRIEELFVKAGFDLVTRRAQADVSWRDLAEARDEQGLTRLQQAIRKAGAHLLIRGTANANRAGLENLYGVPAAFYNCDVQARIYATDTGRLLASESLPATRRGVRSRKEFSPQAAREALVQATFPEPEDMTGRRALATRLYESVMEQWSTHLTAGGDIDLEVKPLDFKLFLKLKEALAGLEGISSVDGDFTENTAHYRLKATITAQTLAELLTKEPICNWIEISDLKPTRIRATGTAP